METGRLTGFLTPQRPVKPEKATPISTPQKPVEPEKATRQNLPRGRDIAAPAPSDGVIGNFKQGQMNDCFVLSAINAVSHTDAGKDSIKNDIKDNGDGTYSVTLPGDKAHKSYTVTQDDLKKGYATGDVDVSILAAAMEKCANDPSNKDEAKKYIGSGFATADSDPPITFNHGGDSMYIMKLLGGDQVKSDKSLSGSDGQDKIRDFLVNQASKVGSGSALVFSGIPNQDTGDWAPNTNNDESHQFAINKIDLKDDSADGGTVYYTNPWDTSVVHKISVDALSKGLAQDKSQGADLESINFSG